MSDILSRLFPYFAAFVLGIIARRTRIISTKEGKSLLKLIFYILTPCLILKIIPEIEITKKQLFLPIIAISILLFEFLISTIIAKKLTTDKKKQGVIILASSIMNTGLILPFVYEFAGDSGIGNLFIFDLGNMVVVVTFLYMIAALYSSKSVRNSFKSLLLSPPVWALILGYLLNFLDLRFPPYVNSFLDFTGSTTFPMILIALGSLLEFRTDDIKLIIAPIFLRMIIGFSIGLAVITLFRLQDSFKLIVILASSSPCGFNTVIFSSIHGLNTKNAATTVSVSLILSLITIPILLYFFM